MAQASYMAKVAADVATTKARMLAIRNEAAQRTIEIMQTPGPSVANPGASAGGAMPIDSGFLRASLMAGLGGANFALKDNPNPDGRHRYDGGEVALVIASADLNDTITAVYTARYARIVEERYAFVRLAAQRWPQTVDGVVAEVKARTGG
jgi:hypothetical protein